MTFSRPALARGRRLASGDVQAHLIHVEGLRLLDQVLEHGRWHRTGPAVNEHAIAKRHDRRNRLDPNGGGELLFGLGVDLGVDNVWVRLCRAIEDGGEGAAWTAP